MNEKSWVTKAREWLCRMGVHTPRFWAYRDQSGEAHYLAQCGCGEVRAFNRWRCWANFRSPEVPEDPFAHGSRWRRESERFRERSSRHGR